MPKIKMSRPLLSAGQIALFSLLIQIHILNDKQCRSRPVEEANWSGSTLFAKAEYIRAQQDQV